MSAGLAAVLAVLVAPSAGRAGFPVPRPEIRVAAAADLSSAFAELASAFTLATGRKVTVSFGASGLLARQIEQGAPFDGFMAASAEYVGAAVRSGACDGATRATYARGSLVVWVGGGSSPPRDLAALAAPRFRRVAIAHPDHAPYGGAAKEALAEAGAYPALAPRLVYGENVRQALQFARTGNVEAAIVSRSLVAGLEGGTWSAVPERLHRPLDQTLVACRRGRDFEGGKSFARFVLGPGGQAILRRYGFKESP